MKPVTALGLLLLLVAYASCENYGINLFKDYLRNGKEYDSILSGEIPPKYLYFYRASPSLLLPEGGGTKRNQFWRSVGRKELEEEGPLEFPDDPRELAAVRPIAARTFLAKRDLAEDQQRSKDQQQTKKALFSWPAEPRRPDELRIKTASGGY